MRKLLVGLTIVGIGLGSAFAYTRATRRADCPGVMTCPLTGQPICKDRCPAR